MFNLWWLPMLSDIEVLKNTRTDDMFHNYVLITIAVLKGIFYQKLPETGFPTSIHKFILTKR
jgi:hypothetical protein